MNKLLILLIFVIFFKANSLKFLDTTVTNTTYDETIANVSWYFCGASYCSPDNIKKWNVAITSTLYPDFEDVYVFFNSTGDNLGFSGYERSTNSVFLVFRGSDNIENWMENLDTVQTDYKYCDGCAVHAGFFAAYNDVRADVLSTMTNLNKKYPNAQIIVTGHSLGAALATLAYVDLYALFGEVDYLYTFGSPRVGNDKFAAYASQQLGRGFKARITHYEDIIPHLPFSMWGFTHMDREVFYNEPCTSYTICQAGEEDPNCSYQYSVISWSVSDHQNYMGFDKETMKC